MDTKLKNSKFNPIIKAVVLILTLVFAFLAGTNGLELARKTIYFNNAERLQDSPVFKENVEIINLIFVVQLLDVVLKNNQCCGRYQNRQYQCDNMDILFDSSFLFEESLDLFAVLVEPVNAIKRYEQA